MRSPGTEVGRFVRRGSDREGRKPSRLDMGGGGKQRAEALGLRETEGGLDEAHVGAQGAELESGVLADSRESAQLAVRHVAGAGKGVARGKRQVNDVDRPPKRARMRRRIVSA